MQRRIEFTATGSSALVGNFSVGDLWTGPADHCAHLVEVHGCAKWADVNSAPTSDQGANPGSKKVEVKKKGGTK